MHFRRHTLGEISALEKCGRLSEFTKQTATVSLGGRHNCGVARSGGKPNASSLNTVLFFLNGFQSFATNKAEEYLVSPKRYRF
jgi:hypothetical protein